MMTLRSGLRLLVAAATLLQAPAIAVPSGWRAASSTHFLVYSEAGPQALQRFAERLERFDAALRHLFPVSPEARATGRLTVYQLASITDVQRIMGPGYANAAGVYHQSIAGSMALTAQVESERQDISTQEILLHEYAHHFMMRNFAAAYPRWFVEGFAEFVATARFDPDGSVLIGAPALHRAWGIGNGDRLSWARILSDDPGKLDAADTEVLYARSWLFTHMLFFDPARAGQLGRYLQAINSGASPAKAMAVFGDMRALERDADRYLRQPKFPALRVPAAAIAPATVTVADVGAAESAVIPVRAQSRYGVDRATALRLLPLARRVAAAYPREAVTQCMLAEAEDDAGNLAEADAAADRLLAIAPASACGLQYKGDVAAHRAAARKAPPEDREWSVARDWYVRANHAEGEAPLPMYSFYQTFRLAHAAPSRNAVEALVGAAERAPEVDHVRVAAAVEMLRLHRPNDARAMLGPVANDTHADGGDFYSELYRRIGTDPDTTIAERLAVGPPAGDKAATAGR